MRRHRPILAGIFGGMFGAGLLLALLGATVLPPPAGGFIHVDTTQASTTGTVKQTLATYTLPANFITTVGQCVRITAHFFTGAAVTNKTAEVSYISGGTSLFLGQTTGTTASMSFRIGVTVCKSATNTRRVSTETRTSVPTMGQTSSTQSSADFEDTDVVTLNAAMTTATSGDGTFVMWVIERINDTGN